MHRYLHHCDYDGHMMELKVQVRSAVLELCCNVCTLSPKEVVLPKTWTSGQIRQILLEQWGPIHSMCLQHPRAGMGQSALFAGTAATECPREDTWKETMAIFRVLSAMMDHHPSVSHQPVLDHAAYQWCARQCTVVEVVRADRIYRMRFVTPAACAEMRQHDTFRDKIKAEVLRCAAESESADLPFQRNAVRAIREELMHRSLGDGTLLGALHRHQRPVRRAPTLLALLINLWLLLCESMYYRHGAASGRPDRLLLRSEYAWHQLLGHWLLQALMVSHVAATALRLLWYSVMQAHMVEGQAPGGEAFGAPHWVWSVGTALGLGYLLGGAPAGLALALAVPIVHRVASGRVYLRVLVTSHTCWRELVFLAVAVCGLRVSEFCFVFHMVELLESDAVRLLLRAATLNSAKLGQTALVIFLTVYFYAALGFRFFQRHHAGAKCATLLGCVTSYMDGGLSGSGIHGTLEFESPASLWDGEWLQWVLLFIQMSFLTIYVQILLVIAQGIIIDSFAQLRDQRAQVLARLKGACFICGLDRAVLAQGPGGVDAHLGEHHNYWHYVDLFVFLQTADRTCLTDLEEYVYDCVHGPDDTAAWIPRNTCLAMDCNQSARQDRQMEAVQEQLDSLSERQQKLESTANEKIDRIHELMLGFSERLEVSQAPYART